MKKLEVFDIQVDYKQEKFSGYIEIGKKTIHIKGRYSVDWNDIGYMTVVVNPNWVYGIKSPSIIDTIDLAKKIKQLETDEWQTYHEET